MVLYEARTQLLNIIYTSFGFKELKTFYWLYGLELSDSSKVQWRALVNTIIYPTVQLKAWNFFSGYTIFEDRTTSMELAILNNDNLGYVIIFCTA
jgi:hypothetical protein